MRRKPEKSILHSIGFISENLYIENGKDFSGLRRRGAFNDILSLTLNPEQTIILEWKFDKTGRASEWRLKAPGFKFSEQWFRYPEKNLDFKALLYASGGNGNPNNKTYVVEGEKWKSVLGFWLLLALAVAIKIISVAFGAFPEGSQGGYFSERIRPALNVAADLVANFTFSDFFKILAGSMLRQPEIMLALGACASAVVFVKFVPRVSLPGDLYEWRIALSFFVGFILFAGLLTILPTLGKVVALSLVGVFLLAVAYRSSVLWQFNRILRRMRSVAWAYRGSQRRVPQSALDLIVNPKNDELDLLAREISTEIELVVNELEAKRDESFSDREMINRLNASIHLSMILVESERSIRKGQGFDRRRLENRVNLVRAIDRVCDWCYHNILPLTIVALLAWFCFNPTPCMKGVCVTVGGDRIGAFVVESNPVTLLLDNPRKIIIVGSWSGLDVESGMCSTDTAS